MVNRQEEPSIGELFAQLATDTSSLVRQEVQLAKVELGVKAKQLGKDVGLVAIGGAVAYAGLLAVIAAVILLVAQYMAPWLSALLIGLVVLAIGYFLSQQHLNALKHFDPTPQATIETLKQDKEWAKEQMR
jgi:uncharacterized membrane protein YqjE